MSVKFSIETQNKKDGLWTVLQELEWDDVLVVKVKRKFLFWEIASHVCEQNPRLISVTRKKARKIAEKHFEDTKHSTRIRECEEAIDDSGPWYPEEWKRVIWKDGRWL